MPQDPLSLAVILFELVVMAFALSLHDLAQAWAANRLGDPTARMLGRMTLNPVVHFDPWGMGLSPLLSIFIFHNRLPFGWSKPVPTTYRNFHSKNGEMLAVCAGPVAQLLCAVVALIVLLILKHSGAASLETMMYVKFVAMRAPVEFIGTLPNIFPVMLLLYLCIMMNLLLVCLNLLPMPFFDGGRILLHFLPYNAARAYESYSNFFLIGFFFLAGPLVYIAFNPLIRIFDSFLF
jgi:Zn-dependent protease